MTGTNDIILRLCRNALDTSPSGSPDLSALTAAGWREVMDVSFVQGVDPICVDGYCDTPVRAETPEKSREIEDLKCCWFCSVIETEKDYLRYEPKVTDLCRLYSENGFRPVLLKGLGLSMNYPVPQHRLCGDIDIFLSGDDSVSREGDLMIREKLGVRVMKSVLGHHSRFTFRGTEVENHYELSNSYFGGRRTARLEESLRELISAGLWKPYDGCPYFLPSADFNAVFLIWHLGTHFCIGRIHLRYVFDWFCLLKMHHAGIDWPRVRRIWAEAGLTQFAEAIGAMLRKYFGMPEEWMPIENPALALRNGDRVMQDILSDRGGRKRRSGMDNLWHYVRRGWKYSLVGYRHWIVPMVESAWMHVFRRDDLVEKEVK